MSGIDGLLTSKLKIGAFIDKEELEENDVVGKNGHTVRQSICLIQAPY